MHCGGRRAGAPFVHFAKLILQSQAFSLSCNTRVCILHHVVSVPPHQWPKDCCRYLVYKGLLLMPVPGEHFRIWQLPSEDIQGTANSDVHPPISSSLDALQIVLLAGFTSVYCRHDSRIRRALGRNGSYSCLI